jgi:hypothetical protein
VLPGGTVADDDMSEFGLLFVRVTADFIFAGAARAGADVATIAAAAIAIAENFFM